MKKIVKAIPLLLVFCLFLSWNASAGDEPGEQFMLYPAYMIMPLGQHVTLDTDTAPVGKQIIWASSDPSVATVDENGRITPIAVGEAVISATFIDDASVTSSCSVLVVAEGSIFLWEFMPGREDMDAFREMLLIAPEVEAEGSDTNLN